MSGTTTCDAQRDTNRPDTEAGDGTSTRRELRLGRTGFEQTGVQPPTAARPATAERSRWQRTADSFVARLREAQTERLAATDPGITRLFYAVVAFNLLIIGVALLRGPDADGLPVEFLEEGLVTVLSSIYLTLTGVLALGCGLLYDRVSRWGRAFWLGLGGVFLVLALDERLQFHERAGNAVHTAGDSGPFRNWNDVVVMGYGVAAVVVAVVFLPEIVRLPKGAFFFGLAFVFYVIHTAIDSIWGSHYTVAPIPEESAKLFARSLFLLAVVAAFVTLLRRWKAAPEAPAELAELAEPHS